MYIFHMFQLLFTMKLAYTSLSCIYSVTNCPSCTQSGGGLPPEVEEAEETMEVGINNEAAGNVHGELLFRIQELEDELKDSEQKRIHNVVALQNKLEATREEKGRIHLEMANLEARLLSVLSSQVRMEGLRQTVRRAMCDSSISYFRLSSLPHNLHLHQPLLPHCHLHQHTMWRLKLRN